MVFSRRDAGEGFLRMPPCRLGQLDTHNAPTDRPQQNAGELEALDAEGNADDGDVRPALSSNARPTAQNHRVSFSAEI
jgi:hypothetical protein